MPGIPLLISGVFRVRPFDKAPAWLAAKNHGTECISLIARAARRLTDTRWLAQSKSVPHRPSFPGHLHTQLPVFFKLILLGPIPFYLIFKYFDKCFRYIF